MKNKIIIMALLLLGLNQTITAKTDGNINSPVGHAIDYGIEDGWYEATVRYENYSTGTYATYTLDVKVQYNSVVEIDFGNEGSIHSGYNNSGYFYSGGSLSLQTDYSGNTVAATTTVTVSDGNGTRYFKISID